MRRALAQCALNRAEVCNRLTKAVGRKISLGMLDNWCADTKTPWHLPADVVPALAQVTGDDGIERQFLCERARLYLTTGEFVFANPTILTKFENELMKVVFRKLYGKRGPALAAKARKQLKHLPVRAERS